MCLGTKDIHADICLLKLNNNIFNYNNLPNLL